MIVNKLENIIAGGRLNVMSLAIKLAFLIKVA